MPARNPLDHSGDGACGQHTTNASAYRDDLLPGPNRPREDELVQDDVDVSEVGASSPKSFYIDKREAEPRGACLGSTGTEVRGGGEVPIAADHAAQVPAAVLRPMVRG